MEFIFIISGLAVTQADLKDSRGSANNTESLVGTSTKLELILSADDGQNPASDALVCLSVAHTLLNNFPP